MYGIRIGLTQSLQMTSSILVLVLHVCHIKSTETSGCHPAVLSLGRVTQTFSFGESPEKKCTSRTKHVH